jgi:predicted nucleic acid-binding protein
MPVVVDTSVAIKWVLAEVYTANARALRDDRIHQQDVLYAPHLLLSEATNVLFQNVRRGALSLSSGQQRLSLDYS